METPTLSLTSSERACRVSPRPSAARVTDKPRGSRHCRRTMPPGCGGLCIDMVGTPSSVVIHVIDIDGRCGFEAGGYTPFRGHGSDEVALHRAAEPMKPTTGQIYAVGSR